MGIRRLRDTLTSTIRRVRAGETIEITHDGVPVAVLAPAPADRVGRLVAAGAAWPPEPLERPLRRFPVETATTASAALEDDRAGR
jgi:prevent-host-death family protein